MTHSKDRIDPRIVRTRQALKDAFIDLLQAMDVEKITVNRLAERSTIHRVTFYLHYRDIPDMMNKFANEMVEEINHAIYGDKSADAMCEREKGVPLEKLLEHIAQNEKFYKVVIAMKRIPIFTERLSMILAETVTDRIKQKGNGLSAAKGDIENSIAVWYISSALIGAIIFWLRNDMPYAPRYLAKQILSLLPSPS
ncbi:TetR/AcrR family transcriptional regulator [Gorillibacterium massiliense]|uniref:TetR/AcrR family transcriptional regulator n=1 Tax=Gorillibacterium massiliense TaxID=1280390 RepID=UPI0004B21DD6|nr:TetR-like C-terminal domain-containing protein [Gorillibacterium massiliense]